MSLGLRAGSPLNALFGLFTLHGSRKLKELADHARAYAQHHHIEAAFRSYETQRGWHIVFHPAAPEIMASLQGSSVILDARTLEAGPGYHAFVVGFLDYLTEHHQWTWEVQSAPRHLGDDTGYAQDRDFAALQTLMAGEFTAMCHGLVELEAGDHSPQNVWLPQLFDLATDDFAATSLGFRDRAFFAAPNPDAFFPWWEGGVTAQTVKNLALSKMWLDVAWTPPANAREQQDLQTCRLLIDRARVLGATFADDQGSDDIDSLLCGEAVGADGIGYLRQDTWYLETGGWWIALSTGYRAELDTDRQTWSLLSDDRGVYMQSYFFEDARAHLDWPDKLSDTYSEYLRFKTDAYWAVLQSGEMEAEGDEGPWFVWEGIYSSLTGSARITLVSCYQNDAAWAEKVLRSVRPERDSPMITLDPVRGPEEL